MSLNTIAVLGLGKVGTLAAKLLHHNGFAVTAFDSRRLPDALPFATQRIDLASDAGIQAATQGFDAVLSCLLVREAVYRGGEVTMKELRQAQT